MSLNYKKTDLKVIKKLLIPCAVFSFFLSTTIVIGHALFNYGTLDTLLSSKGFIKGLLLILIFSGILTGVSSIIVILTNIVENSTTTLWRIYNHPWLFGILFFLCWLPCYLAYYPGIFSYDMDSQIPQILGTIPYSKYHPPLHTFGFQICYTLEEFTGISGLVIYSIIQMCLLAIAFTYLIYLFISLKLNNGILFLSVLFICFNPIIAIFSFIPAKDISFTIFFILYSVELCLFIKKRAAYTHNLFAMIRLIVFGLLCCLFRNNMIYAIILSAAISFFLLKKHRKHWLITNACIITAYFLINGPLYTALGIAEGNPREMLSVPIQQISNVMVHCEPELSDEELTILNQYLPVDELDTLYNPRFADPVKNTFNTESFKKDKASFFEIWFLLLKEYPKEYITSFLNLNLPYWYIDANSVDTYSNRIYIETFIYDPTITGYDVVRDSKFPWLYNKYEVFANFRTIQNIPGLSHFFSISLPIWVLLLTCTVMIAKRKKMCIYIVLPHICYWLTFLLGPVSNLRYVFALIALYPLYLALLINTQCFSPDE